MKLLLDWQEFTDYKNFLAESGYADPGAGAPDKDLVRTKILVNYGIQALAAKYKFFAELIYKLRIIYTRGIPTAAVDGSRLFINPSFFAPLTQQQVIFILCHEVMHCALLHFGRMSGRDPERWNVAGDYEINLLLAEDGVLSINEIDERLRGLINKDYKGKNAEQLYDDPALIMPSKKSDDLNGEGSGGEGSGTLQTGDVIFDEGSGSYGRVESINQETGEVEFTPISENEAKNIIEID